MLKDAVRGLGGIVKFPLGQEKTPVSKLFAAGPALSTRRCRVSAAGWRVDSVRIRGSILWNTEEWVLRTIRPFLLGMRVRRGHQVVKVRSGQEPSAI